MYPTSINGDEVIYPYDAAGNRKTKTTNKTGTTTYDYNGANQLTKVNGQTFEVDNNGNLTKDDKFHYEWNAFDQLTKVSTIEGATVAEYQYDDQGRRVYSKNSKGETYYRYNGTSNQVLFEEDAYSKITKTYTYDDNGYPLTMTYEEKTYYYLTNYRGDVLALVDEAGERVATYTYDAWGNILTQSDDDSIASINPYRYAGYRYDEETKLYYLMARYYNPNTGVFLSLDPVRGDITNPISLNGYNYANNNPVMNVDPNGEASFSTFFNRVKNGLLYGIGKWLSFYVPASLYRAIQSGSYAPYILFGEKILNGVRNSIKAYSQGKKSLSGLVSDVKKTMLSNRAEQQKLIKAARNQIRKYSAQMAGKVLLKSVFSPADAGIIAWYTVVGVKNKYGWSRAWK